MVIGLLIFFQKVDSLDLVQENFCKNFYNKVPGFYKASSWHEDRMFKKHKTYFDKKVPKPKVLALRTGRFRGPKNPKTVWGAPIKPLGELKKAQLRVRSRPIIANFKEVCKKEKCEPLLLLSIICRAIFMDPNGGHFDYKVGKFFQEIIKGRLFI